MASFIAGALAGALSKSVIAPLDRTKIYFQIFSKKPYSMKAAIKFIIKTYKKEGFFALYRGNSVMMIRIMPFAAIQFASYEQFKIIFNVDKDGFLSGTLAAITASCITYPLDTIRAQFATQKNTTLKPLIINKYKTSGILGFYHGMWPTLCGIIPYAGTSFFTHSTLKIWYKEYYNKPVGALENFGFGAISGVYGQILSYPLDVVRRRMQTGMLENSKGIFYSLCEIGKKEGIKGGLYKGLSMNWVKGPISTGIVFSTYDKIYTNLKILFNDLKSL